jgi:hypothetical protein
MVIDDVWHAGDLRPFLQGGQRCARLVTTRNRDTLPLGVLETRVDAMKLREAVQLLGAGLPDEAPEAMASLAARLGEWPLLVELANGLLRRRVELDTGARLRQPDLRPAWPDGLRRGQRDQPA